ncbi:MAG: hypothetical protein AAF674_11475 [Pseudomonadota bacterium]
MLRLILFVILLSVPVRAEMPAGHDDPRLQAAVEAWLDGDDTALRTFRDMAGEGNVAALILRSRARTRHAEQAPSLPPIDYFWLDFAKDSPLALALNLSWEDLPKRTPEEVVQTFLELGELRLAARRLLHESNVAERESKEIPVSQGIMQKLLLSELDAVQRLVLTYALFDYLEDRTLEAIILSLCKEAVAAPDHLLPLHELCVRIRYGESELPIRNVLIGIQPELDPYGHGQAIVAKWLSARTDLPYARLCARICPRAAEDCASAIFRQTSKAFGVAELGSPIETLLPQEQYIRSRRADLRLWAKTMRSRQLTLEYQLDSGWGEAPRCVLRALDAGANPWRAAN